MQTFTKDSLEEPVLINGWMEFQKVATTRAKRIEGPFRVETSEGPVVCQDGYLCIDARGYPYPVAKEEFDLIYRPVEHRGD